MKKRFDFVLKYLKKSLFKFLNWVEQEKYSLGYLVGVTITIIISVSSLDEYKKIVLLFVFFFMFYVGFIFCLGEKVTESKIPKPPKRFVYKDGDGNLYIDSENIREAVQYIHEIEIFIEKQGE